MTITLSDAMQRKLKTAPDGWQNLISDGPTVDALRKRGLVELRNRPGETGIMAGFQWRITEAGCEIDGRSPLRFEVTVWDDLEGNILKKLWEATPDEAHELREQYADTPYVTVVMRNLCDD
jgi:hypothetical protein